MEDLGRWMQIVLVVGLAVGFNHIIEVLRSDLDVFCYEFYSMDKVKFYYDNRVEEEWKRSDRYRIEHAITLKIFDKWLPKTPGLRICDIGGGPGRYSILLTKRGYNVTLFDLSEKNIQYAKG